MKTLLFIVVLVFIGGAFYLANRHNTNVKSYTKAVKSSLAVVKNSANSPAKLSNVSYIKEKFEIYVIAFQTNCLKNKRGMKK